jgi:hypothetical protein
MKRISGNLIGIFLAAVGAPALAHDAMSGWTYPQWCCTPTNRPDGQGDCQAILTRTVRIVAGGYRVTIGPGDHALATKVHVFEIPMEQAKESEDGDYHLCLFPSEDYLRCFFAPPMGY